MAPVLPNRTVAATPWLRVNSPVPVKVKLVAVSISKIVDDAKVLVSAMFPDPNAIARVFEVFERKTAVLKVKPARLSVPAVNVVLLGDPDPVVIASASVSVPPGIFIVALLMVLPLLVIAPEARKVATTDV